MKRYARVLVSVSLLVVVLLCGMVFGPRTARRWVDATAKRSFDSAEWKSHDTPPKDRQSAVRIHMVDNLMKDHLAVGQSRAEVEDLLGSPIFTRQGPDELTISYYPMDDLTLCGGGLESCGCEELRIVYDGGMRVSGFYVAVTSLPCRW